MTKVQSELASINYTKQIYLKQRDYYFLRSFNFTTLIGGVNLNKKPINHVYGIYGNQVTTVLFILKGHL